MHTRTQFGFAFISAIIYTARAAPFMFDSAENAFDAVSPKENR